MTSPAEPRVSRAAAVVAAATLAAALLFMAHGTHVALRDHYTAPMFDEWLILDRFFAQPFLPWLLEDQNGHRLPATRLLLAFDYTMLGGHQRLLVVGALACAWLTFAAAVIPLASQAAPSRWGPVLAFTGFALFWAGSCHDFVRGLNQGSQQATTLLFLALAALAVCQGRRLEGRAPGRLVFLAALAAFGTTFSQGIGSAAWAALVVVALIARFPGRVTVALALAGIASVTLYGFGARRPYPNSAAAYLTILTRGMVDLLSYAASFVGIAPDIVVAGMTTGSSAWLGAGLGFGVAGLAGLAAYGAWLVVRRRPISPPEMVALGLMTFAATGAILVGLNRMMSGMMGHNRFVTWSTIFWIGAAWALGTLAWQRPARAYLLAAALVAVALSSLPALRQARISQASIRAAFQHQAHMLLFDVPIDHLLRDPAMRGPVRRAADRLRRDRRGVFADPAAALPGASLEERFTRVAAGCTGRVVYLARVDSSAGPVAQLTGHAWDDVAEAPPLLVVLTDESDLILGLGTVTQFPRNVADDPRVPGAPWVGFVPAPRPMGRYSAHAVLADGRSLCHLASLPGARLASAPPRTP